jgi:glutaredoxin
MVNVKLFTHNECVHCVAVRRFLSEHDIPFSDVDIERTPGALDELVQLTGSATHVPVIAVDDSVFVDFDESIARKLLEIGPTTS